MGRIEWHSSLSHNEINGDIAVATELERISI